MRKKSSASFTILIGFTYIYAFSPALQLRIGKYRLISYSRLCRTFVGALCSSHTCDIKYSECNQHISVWRTVSLKISQNHLIIVTADKPTIVTHYRILMATCMYSWTFIRVEHGTHHFYFDVMRKISLRWIQRSGRSNGSYSSALWKFGIKSKHTYMHKIWRGKLNGRHTEWKTTMNRTVWE